MRILVTGGAGYIGSHTVRLLLANGHQVVVYDNLSMGHRESVSTGCLVVADLKDVDHLDHMLLINRIEAVVHFAASAAVGESVVNPAKYYLNNLVNTLHLMERMRRNGVSKMVFSSTCATFGTPERLPITEETPQNPINSYGWSKLLIEKALTDYASAYGWGFAALRYFNAAGASPSGDIGEDHDPETHLIPLAFQTILGQRPHIEIFGSDYPTPDGTCIRDYIHVDDLAEAHVLALEKLQPGAMLKYNLGIGKGYSVREVIATAEKLSGRTVTVKIGQRRTGDPAELVASPAKIGKELGWRPKYLELEPILETAWLWHRTHPKGFASAR